MKRLIYLSLLLSIFLVGCSKEEVIDPKTEIQSIDQPESEPEITSENEKGEGIHFLITITNYFGRDIGTITYKSASLAGTWEHEYDQADRLSRSIFYDDGLSRILKEITYSNYSSDILEMDLEVKTYTYFYGFPRIHVMNTRLRLNEDFSANSITDEDDGYQSFDELNAQGYVTKLGLFINEDTKLWTTNYEYDEEGNTTKYYTTYHKYYIQDASVDYTYTDFGDPKTYKFQNEEGNFSNTEYFYRSNNTLERLEETYDYGGDNAASMTYFYDVEEAFSKKLINFEDGSKIIETYEEGKIMERHFRADETLKEVRNLKIWENNIYCDNTEYYDEEGNLVYTEYYDENCQISDTVYE